MNRLTTHDFLAASAPTLGAITVAEFNQAAQGLGALVGLAYLVWKWHRESQKPARNTPRAD